MSKAKRTLTGEDDTHVPRREPPDEGQPVPPDDQQLVEMLRAGGPDANVAGYWILTSYGPQIRSLMRSEGIPAPQLDEAFSEGLVLLCRKLHLYDPAKGSLQGWFAKMTLNAARSALRREAIERRAVIRHATESRQDIPEHDEDAPTHPRLLRILEAVESLPPKDRAIADAAAQAGGNPWVRPVAQELRMTEGAVRARSSRIFAWLRKLG